MVGLAVDYDSESSSESMIESISNAAAVAAASERGNQPQPVEEVAV